MFHARPSASKTTPPLGRRQTTRSSSVATSDRDYEEEEEEEGTGTSTSTSTTSPLHHDDAGEADEVELAVSAAAADLDLDLSGAFRRIMLPDENSSDGDNYSEESEYDDTSSPPSSSFSSGFTGGVGVVEERGGGRDWNNTGDAEGGRGLTSGSSSSGDSGSGSRGDDDGDDEESVSEMYERMMRTFEDSDEGNVSPPRTGREDADDDSAVSAAADGRDDDGLSGAAAADDSSMPPQPDDGYGNGGGGLGIFFGLAGVGSRDDEDDDYDIIPSVREVSLPPPLPQPALTTDLLEPLTAGAGGGGGGGPGEEEEEKEEESMIRNTKPPHRHRRDFDASPSDGVGDDVAELDSGDGDGAIAGVGAGGVGGPLHRRLEDEFDRHTDDAGSSGVGSSSSSSSGRRSQHATSPPRAPIGGIEAKADDDAASASSRHHLRSPGRRPGEGPGPLSSSEQQRSPPKPKRHSSDVGVRGGDDDNRIFRDKGHEIQHGGRRLDGLRDRIPGREDHPRTTDTLLFTAPSPVFYHEYDDGGGVGGWTPTPFELEFAGTIPVDGGKIATTEIGGAVTDADGDDDDGGGLATVGGNERWSGCKCRGTNSYSFLHDAPPTTDADGTAAIRADRPDRERPEDDRGVNDVDGDGPKSSHFRRGTPGRGRGDRRHQTPIRSEHDHEGKKPSPCPATTARREDLHESDGTVESESEAADFDVDGGGEGEGAKDKPRRTRGRTTPRRQRYCGMRRGGGPSPYLGEEGRDSGRRRGTTISSSSPRRRRVGFGSGDRQNTPRVDIRELRVSTSFSPIRLDDGDVEDGADGGLRTTPDEVFDELDGLLRRFGDEEGFDDDDHRSHAHPTWPPRPTTTAMAEDSSTGAGADGARPTVVRQSPFAAAETTGGRSSRRDPFAAMTEDLAATVRGSRRSLLSWDEAAQRPPTSSTSSPSASESLRSHGGDDDEDAAGAAHDGGRGVDDGPSEGTRAGETDAVERVQLWLARNREAERRIHPAAPNDDVASAPPLRRGVSWGTTTAAPCVPPAETTVPSGVAAAGPSPPRFDRDPSPLFSDDTCTSSATIREEQLSALVSSLESKVGALNEELGWERERNGRLGSRMDELLMERGTSAIVGTTGDRNAAEPRRSLPQSFADEDREGCIVPIGNVYPPDDSGAVDEEVEFDSAGAHGGLLSDHHRLEGEELRRPAVRSSPEESASASRHERSHEEPIDVRVHVRNDDDVEGRKSHVEPHETITGEGDGEDRMHQALSKVAHPEQTVDDLESALSRKGEVLQDLKSKISSLEREAEERRDTLSSREIEILDLRSKLSAAESSLLEKTQEVNGMRTDLVTARDDANRAREEVHQLRKRLSGIERELRERSLLLTEQPHRSVEDGVGPLEDNDERGRKNGDLSENIPANNQTNYENEVEMPRRRVGGADAKVTEIEADTTAPTENDRQSSEIDQVNDGREDRASSVVPSVEGRIVADHSNVPNTVDSCALKKPNSAETSDDDPANKKLLVANAALRESLARAREEYAAKLDEMEGERILEKEEAEKAVAELVVELDRTDRERADCLMRLGDSERELALERERVAKLRADLLVHADKVIGPDDAQKRGIVSLQDNDGIEGSFTAARNGSNITLSNGFHEVQVPATTLPQKGEDVVGVVRENQLLRERLRSTDKELTDARERITNLEANLCTTSQELKRKEVRLTDYARQVDEMELNYSKCLVAVKNGEVRLSNKCKEADLLSSKLEEQNQVVAEVDSEKQKIQRMFESATDEIDQRGQDYRDQIAKCEAVARELEVDIASKEKMNDELRARVCQLELDRDSSVRRIDEMVQLLKTNEEQAKQRQVETQLLNEKLAATQGELREVRTEAAIVGTELTEARKRLTDKGQLNSAGTQTIEEKEDQLETMRAQLSETLSMCGNLQIEVIALEESLKAARTEHEHCNIELDRTNIEHENDRQRWSKKVKDLEGLVTANKEEAKLAISELWAEIESADLERAEYCERLHSTEARLQDERRRYSSLESKLESISPEVSEKRDRTDVEKLKAQLSEYEVLVGSLKEQVSQLTERLETAEIEEDRYHQDLDHMQRTCANPERQPNEAREPHGSKAKRALSDLMMPVLEAEVSRIRQQLSEKNEELRKKGQETSNFAKEMDSLRRQHSNNLKELQTMKVALESCTSELASKCSEASDLAAGLSAAQNNEARLSEENQRLGTTLEAAIKEVGQCRQSLSESQQRIYELERKKEEECEIRSRLQQIESELQEAKHKEHILVTEVESLRRRNCGVDPTRTSLSAEELGSKQADDDGKQCSSEYLYKRLLVTHNALLEEYSEAQEKVLFLEEEIRQERSLHRQSIDRMEMDAAELVNADETAEAEAQRADDAEAKLKESRVDLQMARDELSRVLAAKATVEHEYEKAISSMMSYSLGISTHIDGLADISMVSTAVPSQSSHGAEAIELMRLLIAVVSLNENGDDEERSAVVTQAWKSLGRMSSISKAFDTDSGDSQGHDGAPKTPPPTQFVRSEHGAAPKDCDAMDGDVEASVLHPSQSSIFSFLNKDASGQYQNVADGNHSCTSWCDSEMDSDLDVGDEITKLVSDLESQLDEALNDMNSNDAVVTMGAEVLLTPVGKKQFPYKYDEQEQIYREDDELHMLSLRCQEAQQERDVALNERDQLLAETLDLIEVTKQEQLAVAEANMASLRNDASRALADAKERFYLMKSFLTWRLRVGQQQKTCRGCNRDLN